MYLLSFAVKMTKKKTSAPPNGAKKGKNFPLSKDPFFSSESRKRRKIVDDEIESGESDEDNGLMGVEDEEFEEETVDEKRKRVAVEYLEKIREIAKREKERGDEEKDEDESDDEGEKDSLVAKILQQEQLEDSGRLRREIASRPCFLLVYFSLEFCIHIFVDLNCVYCPCFPKIHGTSSLSLTHTG